MVAAITTKSKPAARNPKFGLALDELPMNFSRVCRGEQCANRRPARASRARGFSIRDALERGVRATGESSPKRLGSVHTLNVGGGLGVPSRADEDRAGSRRRSSDALAEVKAAYPQFALWSEPGRYLVADAGVLLARVTQLKSQRGCALRRRRCRHELADSAGVVRRVSRNRESISHRTMRQIPQVNLYK